MRRLISVVLVAILAPVLMAGATGVRAASDPWRMLVLVTGGIEGQLSDEVRENMAALASVCWVCGKIAEAEDTPEALTMDAVARTTVATQIERMPDIIDDWSDGRAAAEIDLVFSDVPVQRERMEDSAYGLTVRASTVREQLDDLVTPGEYDSIFILWRNAGALGSIVNKHLGLTWVERDDVTGAWISSLELPSDIGRWEAHSLTHLFIHEWLHQVEHLNLERGNMIARLHDPEDYGYADQPERWYRAFLNGELDRRLDQFTLLAPLPAPEA